MCYGKPKEYDFEFDESIIRILGESYRGKTYKVYFCECGEESGPEGHSTHEIYEGTELYRNCKNCGKVDIRLEY
jgi:hypothetical protein